MYKNVKDMPIEELQQLAQLVMELSMIPEKEDADKQVMLVNEIEKLLRVPEDASVEEDNDTEDTPDTALEVEDDVKEN